MDNKNVPHSSKRIALIMLAVLTGVNGIWAASSLYPGPFIGFIFYGVITFFFWRRNHFHAGVIGGIVGVIIHGGELVVGVTDALKSVDTVLFLINLFLPIPLIYFSYKACSDRY